MIATITIPEYGIVAGQCYQVVNRGTIAQQPVVVIKLEDRKIVVPAKYFQRVARNRL